MFRWRGDKSAAARQEDGVALDDITGTPAQMTQHDEATSAQARRRVIDADAHLDPPHLMWQDYLPRHLRALAPVIEEGNEHDWVVFEGLRRPLKMIANQAGRDGKDFKMTGKVSDMRSAWQPMQRLDDMDLDGIDAAVLFGGGPLGTRNSELYIASFDAYNRWLWDFCAADRNRLTGVAYLPMRDVDETLTMLRQVAKLGFRSINIPAFPQSPDGISTSAQVKAIALGQGAALTGHPTGDRTYRDAEFDKLWAEISELDITVCIHLGGRVPRFGEKKYFLPDMLMSKLAMAEPIAIAIFGGIFQRFPKLRFVSVESGIGWFAFAAEYMDRTWEKQRFWTDSELAEKPSFYMDRNVYGSFINDRHGILNRNIAGARNIMWSSDYPHSETSFPKSHAVIARDFADVPEADIHQIVYARARQVYALP
jgi:predicted TIM-barrel fold metal-dependent hydrolase